MRKNLLVLLLTMFSVKAMSQVSEVESLQSQINKHPAHDTIRVNLLNQMIILNALPATEIERLAKESLLISREILCGGGRVCIIGSWSHQPFYGKL